MKTFTNPPRLNPSSRRVSRLRTFVSVMALAGCSMNEAQDPIRVVAPPAPTDDVSHKTQMLAGQDGDYTVTAANTVLNSYSTLGVTLVPGATTITVAAIAELNNPINGMAVRKGDLLMLYQPQGATVDATDDAAKYGSVTSENGAGYYEIVAVDSVAGNTITLGTCGGIKNSYNVPGAAQVVRIPQFANLTIQAGASVIAKAWDGKSGGIIALHVQGKTTIAGSIDATAQGFRGGQVDPTSNSAGLAKVTTMRSSDPVQGAEKGEGIAGSQDTYQTLLMGKYGRGAVANGGGGGNAHNAGGGGGGGGGDPLLPWTGFGVMDGTTTGGAMAWPLEQAYKDNGNKLTTSTGGGRGGHSFSRPLAGVFTDPTVDGPTLMKWGGDFRQDVGGVGGRPLHPNLGFQVFMGGGGGAGDQDNNSGGPGGNGGGIVYLVSGSVAVPGPNTGIISANGGDGADTSNAHNDGAGGGGGGGSLFLLTAQPLPTDLRLSAEGGYGGNQKRQPGDLSEADGPGGGGSGGLITYIAGGVPKTSIKGGVGGNTIAMAMAKFPANGATNGSDGRIVTIPRQPTVLGLPSYYPICMPSDLSVTVKAPAAQVQPGSNADFTVTVTNGGENIANSAEISTTPPAGVMASQLSWTCAGMGGAQCPNNMTSGIGALPQLVDLPVGGSLSFTVKSPVPASSPTATLNLTVSAQPPPGYVDLMPANNSATGMAPIQGAVVTIPKADLELSLSKNPDAPAPGTETTITATAKNNGPNQADKPVLVFSIPPGSTVTQPPPPPSDPVAPWGCTNDGTTYTCALKTDLAPGATAPALAIKFRTPADIAGNPTPQVTAVISSAGTTDPSPSNNSATVEVGASKGQPKADLALSITKSPTTAGPGTEAGFTLQVTNRGPETSAATTVTFTMPPSSVVTQPATGNGWACTRSVDTYTCLTGPLPAGQAPAISVKLIAPMPKDAVTPAGAVAGVVSSDKTFDPNLGNNSDSKPIAASLPPTGSDLAVRISTDNNSPKAGDTVTYTGIASNRGPDAVQNPVVVFSLPPGATVTQPAQGDGWTCSQTGNTVLCTRGTLPKGDAPPITVKIKYPSLAITGVPPMVLDIDASGNNDPNPNNNTVVVDTRPISPRSTADLALKIEKSPAYSGAGTELTYTLKTTNNGPAAANNPSVAFTVPVGSTITQPALGNNWSCLQLGYGFTCYYASTLQPGSAPDITVKVLTPLPPDPKTDAGSVAGVVSSPSTDDPNLLNNSAAVDVGINPPTASDLQITITADPTAANPGSEVTFTAQAKNNGLDPVKNPVVTIITPPGSELIDGPNGAGWSCTRDANVFLCTRDAIAEKTTAPDITLRVKLPLSDGHAVQTARATVGASNNDDPKTDNNVSTSQPYRLAGGGLACSAAPVGTGTPGWPLSLGSLLLLSAWTLRRRRHAPGTSALT